MLTHKTKLVARIDPLKYLLNKETLTGRLFKWVMILSEFNIEYVDRKSIKGQAIANQLADAPMIDDAPLASEFLDESILAITHTKPWQLYFDDSYTKHSIFVLLFLVSLLLISSLCKRVLGPLKPNFP